MHYNRCINYIRKQLITNCMENRCSTLRFSDVFRGKSKGALGTNVLIKLFFLYVS